ncbi:M23 family metallopeptidase [Arthrobacter sp. MDT1-65]
MERLLGALGSTGNSTGCHRHFEVLVNNDTVNSQPWL